MKKKVIFISLAVLFSLSAITGLSSGSASGFVGCLAIAAVFGFLAYRTAKSPQKAENDSPVLQPNICTPTPPPENLAVPASEPAFVSAASISTPQPVFEFVQMKVAGVTFKNEKGVTRQTILRKINFHDKPFDEYIELELRRYEYEEKPAYGVYANGLQIGNIPADKVQFVSDNLERIDSVSAINVYGGGRNSDGYAISYGCEITLKLRA